MFTWNHLITTDCLTNEPQTEKQKNYRKYRKTYFLFKLFWFINVTNLHNHSKN